jgi:4'-phosphopantetheinyl transferase EntD
MIINFNLVEDKFSSCFSSVFFTANVLLPAEALLANTWAKKRIDDFSTGRYCARAALKPFGFGAFEILKGADKEPLWPPGIVGSISHAEGLVGAVVADARNVLSIGLDIENLGRVKDEMWYLLFTENEQAFLKGFEVIERIFQTTLLFSLKESFYKFQFPFSKTFLNFTDVEIYLEEGQYKINVLKEFPCKTAIPALPVFAWQQHENHVLTLCYY